MDADIETLSDSGSRLTTGTGQHDLGSNARIERSLALIGATSQFGAFCCRKHNRCRGAACSHVCLVGMHGQA